MCMNVRRTPNGGRPTYGLITESDWIFRAYGHRTSAVRGLWVSQDSSAVQTDGMAALVNTLEEETTGSSSERFEDVVLPHLNAAYRLACALTRNEHDAEDAVQEASLRALRYFRTFTGGNGRAWFLRIVRNACLGPRRDYRTTPADEFDEERHLDVRPASDPETLALQAEDARRITEAMDTLSGRFQAILVLRDFEGLSYAELADALGMPVGTVMSRLSRARQAFRDAVARGRNGQAL